MAGHHQGNRFSVDSQGQFEFQRLCPHGDTLDNSGVQCLQGSRCTEGNDHDTGYSCESPERKRPAETGKHDLWLHHVQASFTMRKIANPKPPSPNATSRPSRTSSAAARILTTAASIIAENGTSSRNGITTPHEMHVVSASWRPGKPRIHSARVIDHASMKAAKRSSRARDHARRAEGKWRRKTKSGSHMPERPNRICMATRAIVIPQGRIDQICH